LSVSVSVFVSRYRKNEVFLDVIESVNLLAGASGNVLRYNLNLKFTGGRGGLKGKNGFGWWVESDVCSKMILSSLGRR